MAYASKNLGKGRGMKGTYGKYGGKGAAKGDFATPKRGRKNPGGKKYKPKKGK
jgi:hypothetical protein